MAKWLFNKPVLSAMAGLVLGLAVGVGMLIGALGVGGGSQALLPEIPLHASATDSGDTFAIATGEIAEDVEGVFFLDFLTGQLQCWVIYPRSGQFGAKFTTNIAKDLPIEAGKTPKYLMITGTAALNRGGGNTRPSNCVVYVVDEISGAFAAYSVPWNRNSAQTVRPQQGPILTIGGGKVRNLELRE